jgi:hypothetical protein
MAKSARRLLRCLSPGLLVVWILSGSVDCFQYEVPRTKSTDLGDASVSSAGAAGGTAECPESCSYGDPEGACDEDGVKNGEDCAPCDPTRYRNMDVDDDGDGVPNGGRMVGAICVGAEIPPGFTTGRGSDCDNANPALFQKICLDADQDGWCAPKSEICVGQEIAPGYRLSAYDDSFDCDDSDPTRQQYRFYDDDGDGDRADSAHPSACAEAIYSGPFSLGYLSGGDCDDHDPTVSCSTVDLLFDGRDTNCDGDDGSAQCSQMNNASALCPCWPRDTCRVASTCSDRADLNIVDVEPSSLACSECSYPYLQTPDAGLAIDDGGQNARVLLVNSGGAVFDGTLVVGDRNNTYPSLETRLVLAAGESRIFDICRLAGSVKFEIVSGDDCLPDNNYATIPVQPSMWGD